MRMKRDRDLNNFTYPVLSVHEYAETKSEDIKVGMIVQIKQS
jgi:hypothetical protein